MATAIVPLINQMPPGLNTADPAADLPPGETPDSYGFDLTVDGKVKKGTVPTGTSRVQRAVTISEGGSDIPYLWHGRRLWNITNRTASTASNILTLGALDYDDVFYPPSTRHSRIHFNEDSATILALLPIEPDALFIAKSTGSYILRNISDTRGFYQVSDLRQEMACAAANQAIAINNVVYVGNSDGVISYDNFRTAEASRKIRPDRATVGALAMTADYERGWLVLGSSYVLDTVAEKWFNYSGSAFRLTSRTLRNPDWSPFAPDSLRFSIEHGSTAGGYLSYQTKYEDDQWDTAVDVQMPYTEDKFTVVAESLLAGRSCRKFAIRVTSLSSNIYIREINVEAEGFSVDDYSS